MKKLLTIVFVIVVLAGSLVFRRIRNNGWTVTELFTKLYSERGSAHCGHVTNSHFQGPTSNPEAAIDCAQAALKNHHAFTVMFTGYGTDDEISNALVIHKNGTGLEIFYAVGTVKDGKRLVRHRCDSPVRLVIETDSPFNFPRLHCAEWPPQDLY